MERIAITLPNELLKKIDKKRGLIKRSTFIADVLERGLEE